MKRTYIVILDWMLDLGLSASELLAYATIFGFSQDGETSFCGSRKYLARKMGAASTRTVDKALETLVCRGLIIKEENTVNGVKFCRYRANFEAVEVEDAQIAGGVQKLHGGVQKLQGGCAEFAPNNKEENKEKKVSSNEEAFAHALVSMGVSAEHASDWLKVRKAKRAANTETALAAIRREFSKALEVGYTADDCARIAVEHSWQGFKAEWLQNQFHGTPRPAGSNSRGVAASEAIVADALRQLQTMEG